MANNTVNLNGFLSVEEVKPTAANRTQPAVSVTGWIYTAPAALGGRHPFVATGTPAQVILDYARIAASRDVSPTPLDTRFGVTLRGKLVSMPERSFIEVKHISFFDLSSPLLPENDPFRPFAANLVTLQGHFELRAQKTTTKMDGCLSKVLSGYLHTDKEYAGGNHPVLVAGSLADLLKDRLHEGQNQGCHTIVETTVGGQLVSLNYRIYVQARYLSIPEGGLWPSVPL